MSNINFETDTLKHYVRRCGWLTAAKDQKHAISRRSKRIPLRYFTFCAAEAIDVFMLEREGILERSEETGRLEGVYFCEKDLDKFGIIANLIGSPEQGFRGPFEKIVLFEDDEETEGKTLEDDQPHTHEVREKLIYKDTHCRLRKAFPFDIINLDVCGGVNVFLTNRTVITPLLRINFSDFRVADGIKISNQRSSNVNNSRYFLPLMLTQIGPIKTQSNNLKIGSLRISV